jgi:hypothetical protein
MNHALVVEDAIISVGGLPTAARRLDTGEWVNPNNGEWTEAEAAACGYLPVVTTPRPPDTDTTTHDYAVVLISGVPTEQWTARPKTPDEITAATYAENEEGITADLEQAIVDLQVLLDTVNSAINDNPAAHIKDVARVLKKVCRSLTESFESAE